MSKALSNKVILANAVNAHRDMLMGGIFTPSLYKHVEWENFHIPIIRLEAPKSFGNTCKLKIDNYTAKKIDLCDAFKNFPNIRKYIRSVSIDFSFTTVKIMGAVGLAMMHFILINHLKIKFPNWKSKLDTAPLHPNTIQQKNY